MLYFKLDISEIFDFKLTPKEFRTTYEKGILNMERAKIEKRIEEEKEK
jgi:hypothetical protein